MAGAIIARLTLLLCVLGALVPALMTGGPEDDLLNKLLLTACSLVPGAPPLVGLGMSAWAWRRSAAASATLAVTAVLAVVVSCVGWWIGAQDFKGINAILSLILVPPGQAIIWGVGLSIARSASEDISDHETVPPDAAPDTGS